MASTYIHEVDVNIRSIFKKLPIPAAPQQVPASANLPNLVADSDRTHTFDVIHPVTGEITGLSITVVSSFSTRPDMRLRAVMASPLAAIGAMQTLHGPYAARLNRLFDDAFRAAWSRIDDWSGLEKDGVPMPFNEDNARELFRAAPWVMTQVIDQSDNVFNFRG